MLIDVSLSCLVYIYIYIIYREIPQSDYPILGAIIIRAGELFQHPFLTYKPATNYDTECLNHHPPPAPPCQALGLGRTKTKW